TQFRVTLLDLLEQPHVLDINHSLISKGLKESDLFVSERSRLDSSNEDRAQRFTLTDQRDGQPSPGQQSTLAFPACGLGKLGIQVCGFLINMNFLPLGNGSPGY